MNIIRLILVAINVLLILFLSNDFDINLSFFNFLGKLHVVLTHIFTSLLIIYLIGLWKHKKLSITYLDTMNIVLDFVILTGLINNAEQIGSLITNVHPILGLILYLALNLYLLFNKKYETKTLRKIFLSIIGLLMLITVHLGGKIHMGDKWWIW